MRIAFLVHDFPALSETFILNQATGLIERGHEVHIYTDRLGDTTKVHPDVTAYRLLERTYHLPSIPNHPGLRLLHGIRLWLTHFHKNPGLFLRSLNVFQYGLQAAGFWLVYAAVALYDKPAYDVVHCQFATQGFRGITFCHLIRPRPKLVVMFRGYDISQYVREQGDRVYAPLFKQGDVFLANCEFFRQRVIQLGCRPDRIAVHFSGLDCHKFSFIPRSLRADGRIRIATTGRLVEKKGIEYVIRAIAQLANDYPTLEYTVIGDGPLKHSLQALAEELGISHLVHLLGWRNEQEIIEILNQSDVFVAPSITTEDGNQDAPINVLKEAMAMGLPVISTEHGGIPELVEDGISGFLVPERDVEALVEKLRYLIQHPDQWQAMGQAGRAYVEQHFDLHKLNDRLVNIYQQSHPVIPDQRVPDQRVPESITGSISPSVPSYSKE